MPKGNINGIFERCQVALTSGQRMRERERDAGGKYGGNRRKRQHAKEAEEHNQNLYFMQMAKARERVSFQRKKATFQEAARLKKKSTPLPCSLCLSLPVFLRFLYRKICYCLLSYDLYGRSGKKATAATSTKNRNLSTLKMVAVAVAVGGVR